MVYIDDWALFFDSSKELFAAHPKHTRMLTKYHHGHGQLVVKVTNDVECLKYRCDLSDLRNVERLGSWFLAQATDKAHAPATVAVPKAKRTKK